MSNFIDPNSAKKLMQENENHIIIDVRLQEAYNQSHIKNAINIPLETIDSEKAPEELSDKEQPIFVYCQRGIRSECATQKLKNLGYKNVYDIGSIQAWSEEETAN
ncbi:rhodanese-like domain-containing protein [Actinomyces sp. zg-332]|uniref:rhodanese-like domain-containing protein n=1 Tax=Actinomyces sp. zg-332 TaxID=2708340 RepID=UPI0014236BDB|nr:rhodanese-like domain-containing protein [Actinomyces sp. zg-332]QPK94194.1 rhodanese-like domain-containing protein [Actinomyces sp. zg-332]